MKKIYIIFLLINLALSQAGGGGSDSGYDSGYDGGYDSGSYSGSSSNNAPSSVFEKIMWFVIFSAFSIAIVRKIYNIMMEQKREWLRFMKTKIILPAQYDIEETKQLYLRTRWSIVFKQKATQYDSEVLKVIIKNPVKQSSTHEIQLNGKDNFGSWSATGFISFDDRIRIQFKKIYDNREKAGQTGNWRDLYYEGEMYSQHLIEGIWFYKGYEQDPIYSGTFTLKLVD